MDLRPLLADLSHFPWKSTALTLRERFREDRLGLTASSLTFTTLISLVPLVTVALALFSVFPMFSSFQDALQKYFLQILAGISNAEVVLDPQGELLPGNVVQIPFNLTEADAGVDVILLSPREADSAYEVALRLTPSSSGPSVIPAQ